MACHRHREKRLKENHKNHNKNVSAKRALKKSHKQLLLLIEEKKIDEAKSGLNKLVSAYAKTAKRGIINKNKVSRHISSITKKVNSLMSA